MTIFTKEELLQFLTKMRASTNRKLSKFLPIKFPQTTALFTRIPL